MIVFEKYYNCECTVGVVWTGIGGNSSVCVMLKYCFTKKKKWRPVAWGTKLKKALNFVEREKNQIKREKVIKNIKT